MTLDDAESAESALTLWSHEEELELLKLPRVGLDDLSRVAEDDLKLTVWGMKMTGVGGADWLSRLGVWLTYL